MRRLLLMLIALLPAVAHGQSLAESARQEQARREKLAKEKASAPAPVITEDELKATKGEVVTLGPATSPPAPAPRPAAGRKPGAEPLLQSEEPQTPAAASGAEAYWRSRVAEARNRVAAAQERYDDIDRQIRFGQPGRTDASGRAVQASAQSLQRAADAAQAELAAARKALDDLLEEARHSGALPGWLRD